jgi:hypothetical protein
VVPPPVTVASIFPKPEVQSRKQTVVTVLVHSVKSLVGTAGADPSAAAGMPTRTSEQKTAKRALVILARVRGTFADDVGSLASRVDSSPDKSPTS